MSNTNPLYPTCIKSDEDSGIRFPIYEMDETGERIHIHHTPCRKGIMKTRFHKDEIAEVCDSLNSHKKGRL